MRARARALVAAPVALAVALAAVAPAGAQTGGLEAPSLWLLVASLAQIVGAAALMVFFITRSRPRRCPRCGQRLGRDVAACPRCGKPAGGDRRPGKAGG